MKEITASALVADAKSYGMEWATVTDGLNSGDVQVLSSYPLLRVSDVGTFAESFGTERALHILNASQSLTVSQQGALRNRASKSDSLTFRRDVAAQKMLCATTVLGMRAANIATRTVTVTVEVPTYMVGGVAYKAVSEARAATVAAFVDNGVKADMARTMALALYPLTPEEQDAQKQAATK